MLGHPPDEAWSRWFVESLVIGVGAATAIGCAIGYVAAKLPALAERHKLIENTSLLGYTIAFSLLTLGATHLVGADAVISVFLAGLVFNLCSERDEEHEEEDIQEAVAKLFTLPMFVLFGIALPLSEWLRLGWPLVALAALLLVLRRPPIVAALSPALRGTLNNHDIAYVGWFGPIGVAAMFYASFSSRHLHDPAIWHAAAAVIFASILVHGATAAALTRLYARHPAPSPPLVRERDG
jgi:sodium/hydrogen antiporter